MSRSPSRSYRAVQFYYVCIISRDTKKKVGDDGSPQALIEFHISCLQDVADYWKTSKGNGLSLKTLYAFSKYNLFYCAPRFFSFSTSSSYTTYMLSCMWQHALLKNVLRAVVPPKIQMSFCCFFLTQKFPKHLNVCGESENELPVKMVDYSRLAQQVYELLASTTFILSYWYNPYRVWATACWMCPNTGSVTKAIDKEKCLRQKCPLVLWHPR